MGGGGLPLRVCVSPSVVLLPGRETEAAGEGAELSGKPQARLCGQKAGAGGGGPLRAKKYWETTERREFGRAGMGSVCARRAHPALGTFACSPKQHARDVSIALRADLLWSHTGHSCPCETDLNKVGKEFKTQLMLRPLLTEGGTGGTNPAYLVAYTSPQVRTLLGVSVGPRVSQPGIHVPGVQSKLA